MTTKLPVDTIIGACVALSLLGAILIGCLNILGIDIEYSLKTLAGAIGVILVLRGV